MCGDQGDMLSGFAGFAFLAVLPRLSAVFDPGNKGEPDCHMLQMAPARHCAVRVLLHLFFEGQSNPGRRFE